jgi:predicted Zn finger-like uncharacterized protein
LGFFVRCSSLYDKATALTVVSKVAPPAVADENAMKVQCGQCPAKYAVADERIRDKKVRIRCKRCNATIIVDGKVDPPLVTSSPARKSARPSPSQVSSEIPRPPEREPDSRPFPRPVAHTIMGGLEAPVADRLNQARLEEAKSAAMLAESRAHADEQATLRRLQPELPAGDRGLPDPAGGNANRWRVALTKEDLRWMTTLEITEAYRAGAVKLETFVFRTGMPTWVTLLEVPEIVAALEQSGDVDPESSRAALRSPSSLPPPRRPSPARPRDFAAAPAGLHSRQDEASQADAPDAPLVFEAESGHPDTPRAGESSPLIEIGEDARLSLPELAEDDALHEGDPIAEAADAPRSERGDAAAPAPAEQSSGATLAAAPPRAFPAAEQAAKSPGWLWLLLALLALGALVALLGPRFGLKLP